MSMHVGDLPAGAVAKHKLQHHKVVVDKAPYACWPTLLRNSSGRNTSAMYAPNPVQPFAMGG